MRRLDCVFLGEKPKTGLLRIRLICEIPKFLDARNFAVIHLKFSKVAKPEGFCHANGIANSEDPDQTAPPGAV